MPNTSSTGSQSKKTAGSTAAKKTSSKKNAASTRFAERQARKEEEARLARQERNKRYAFVAIGLAVVLVAVLVIVKFASGGSGTSNNSAAGGDIPSPPRGTPIPTATLSKLQSVPLSTLHSAPTTGILTTPQAVSGKALTANGKPELLYIGAEFCPYCAGERWPMYVALSKFGTFSPNPGKIHSATQDGNIPTFSFYGTSYTSPYFAFTPVEVSTNYLAPNGNYAPLETPTPAQASLWQKGNGGSYPYVNFGGKSQLTEAQFSSATMQNMSFDAVAAQVGDNSTTNGANIGAAASQLIKTICTDLTHNQPAAVCSSS